LNKIANISLYWKCQLIGWCIAALYWGLEGMRAPQATWTAFLFHLIGDVTIGILVTHCYRYLALKFRWTNLSPGKLAWRLIPAVLLIGATYALLIALKLYYIRYTIGGEGNLSLYNYLTHTYRTLLLTGTRLMAIWILIYHGYHYAQRENKIALENAQLIMATREAQLNQLSAQLNPHFFFNSLNTIKFLIAEEPTAARRAVDLLSDLLRHFLYNHDDRVITVTEELQLVNDYLELEKLRFEERLQTTVTVSDDCLPVTLPPLSIQTLVENSIKHGISKLKDGGTITMQLDRIDQQLRIIVTNSGKQAPAEFSNGLGLKNLRKRLELHYDGRFTMHLGETNNQVSVELIIPAYV